ncbi:hypothetical protein Tco_1084396 [Tanacetum coccineum]
MTKSYTKDLFTPFEEPERVFHSTRKLFKTSSLDYLSSLELDLFPDLENQSEKEVTKAMTEPTMEEYMMKTREDYRSGIASGSDNKDANEHIEKVLEIFNLFHILEVTKDQIMLRVFPMSFTGAASRWLMNEPSDIKEVILFYKGLDVPTRQILDSKGTIPTIKADDAKKAIQDMADHSKKWHNGTSTRTRSTDTYNGVDVNHAMDLTTLRIVRLKKKEKHLKKHTTLNLEYHSPKEEDIKQLLWDSTK